MKQVKFNQVYLLCGEHSTVHSGILEEISWERDLKINNGFLT